MSSIISFYFFILLVALVEYLEPSEARQGFTRLAYTKFKHLPLYLEWAPDDSLAPLPPDSAIKKEEKSKTGSKNKNEINGQEEKTTNGKTEKVEEKEESEEEEDEPEPDTTLFVKNLNFTTTDEQLKKVKYCKKCISALKY